ncbi:MAG: hypothetical protein ACRER5_16190 [Pseudomonas sp.]
MSQKRATWSYTHPTDSSLKVHLSLVQRLGLGAKHTATLSRFKNGNLQNSVDGDQLKTQSLDAMERWLKNSHCALVEDEGMELTGKRGLAKTMTLGPDRFVAAAPTPNPVNILPRPKSACPRMVPIVF